MKTRGSTKSNDDDTNLLPGNTWSKKHQAKINTIFMKVEPMLPNKPVKNDMRTKAPPPPPPPEQKRYENRGSESQTEEQII
jgi:hypothetical protein